MFNLFQNCGEGALDHLRLDGLLAKSNKSELCLNEARKVFKTKYYETDFILTHRRWETYYLEDNVNRNTVFAIFMVMRRILNDFGDLIRKFEYNQSDMPISEAEEIIKYINDKSCLSLNKFMIRSISGSVLNNLKENACKNVSELTFSKRYSSSDEEIIEIRRMHELFPNVEILKIIELESIDCSFVIGHFPKLRSIHLKYSSLQEPDDDDAPLLLQTNPQIESLTVEYPSLNFFKKVNDYLPNLKTLNFWSVSQNNYFNYQGDDIQFNTVKNLKISDMYCQWDSCYKIPEKILFTQVQEFYLRIQMAFNEKWFNFISNQINKNLTSLTLEYNAIRDEYILAIPELFPELQIIHFKWMRLEQDLKKPGEIISFIQKFNNLKKLTFTTNQMEESEFDVLRKAVEKYWNFETATQNLGYKNCTIIHITEIR